MNQHNNGANGTNGDGNGNGSVRVNDPTYPAAPGRNLTLSSAPISRMIRPGDDEKQARFNLLDYVRLIWRGKWIVLACFLVAALGSAYYTYSLPFVFQSSLQVMLKDKDEKQIFNSVSGGYQSPDRIIKKEIAMLRSRPILKAAADSLLRQRYLDPTTRDSLIPLVRTAEGVVLRSRAVPLPDSVAHERLVEMLAGSIGRVTNAVPSKDADIITITCKTGDAREAALIANVYATVYVQNSQVQARASAQSVNAFLTNTIGLIGDTLGEQAEKLKQYMASSGIISVEQQGQDLLAQRTRLTDQSNEANIEMRTTGETLAEMQRQLNAIEPSLSSEMAASSSPIIERLQEQVAAKQTELDRLIAGDYLRRSEQWYQGILRSKQNELASLKAKLAQQVEILGNSKLGSLPIADGESEGNGILKVNRLRGDIFRENIKLQGLRARVAAIQAARGDIEAKLAMIPEHMKNLDQLKNAMKGNESVIEDLQTISSQKQVEVQSQFAKVAIMEEAQPNSAHVSPNRVASIVTGSLVGLILGIGIVLLIAHADTTVHSPDDLEKNGYTVLSAISPIDEAKLATLSVPGLVHKLGKVSPHLVSYADPKSPVAESYRSLRTAIQFASIENQVRTILVTSSIPQEGKSTTSTNLAIVISQSGGRTLLVDCDLRRPIVHSIFGMGKEPGLVNALVGGVPLDEAIRETGIPNLSILSSGTIPPNPSELLGSRRMRDMLEQLKDRFDTIVLDSPPVSAVTDAVILSTFADVAITVVRAHKTKMEFLDKTREDIQRVSNSLLGVVLNDFDAAQSYGATYKYYRYYRYYSYYGQSEDETSRKQRRAEAAVKNETVE
jgi:tyrosine-protein kinase Etk/Wzc